MDEKKTILVIEDERQLQQALHEKLTHEGFDVLQAFDGQEGLNMALDRHPDLILLDLVLPTLDGMTILSVLRKDEEWGKNAAVMVLTNLADEKTVKASLENAVFDYLIKTDWTLEDLTQRIKDKLHIN